MEEYREPQRWNIRRCLFRGWLFSFRPNSLNQTCFLSADKFTFYFDVSSTSTRLFRPKKDLTSAENRHLHRFRLITRILLQFYENFARLCTDCLIRFLFIPVGFYRRDIIKIKFSDLSFHFFYVLIKINKNFFNSFIYIISRSSYRSVPKLEQAMDSIVSVMDLWILISRQPVMGKI